MTKQILIAGGGISGLALLHYLKKKYRARPEVSICLFEKNDYLGGTIRTIHEDRCLFETGPNGFLDSKPTTLEFVEELGLTPQLLRANSAAEKRFIFWRDGLHELPGDFKSFWRFRPLSISAKLRVFQEPFISKGANADETVYEFGCRRVGRAFTEVFLDSMVSGIFAGDVRRLNLKAAFPRIYEIEQRYGSLLKGMFALARERQKSGAKNRVPKGQPAGRLTSFPMGMSQLIRALHDRYEDSILSGHSVEDLRKEHGVFQVRTATEQLTADEVYVSAPAYQASALVEHLNPVLARTLSEMPYAPIAVAGLVYNRSQLTVPVPGFGYLIPSSENRDVLGVLFSSNIFKGRSADEEFLFRVMIGGARYPDAAGRSDEQLIAVAKAEVARVLQVKGEPQKIFCARHARAIPQYNQDYPKLRGQIDSELKKIEGLRLVANYLGGISLNDCIVSARDAAEHSAL